MKIRNGFVTNSSSSSFIIRNTSSKDKTLEDFIQENKWLYDEDNSYLKDEVSFDQVLEDARSHDIVFYPGKDTEVVCTDHYSESAAEAIIHNNLDKLSFVKSMLNVFIQINTSASPDVLLNFARDIESVRTQSKNFCWRFGESMH